jgi:hypothetical protein
VRQRNATHESNCCAKLNALATDEAKSPLDDVLDPNKYWEDLTEAGKEKIAYEAQRDAKAVFPYVPFDSQWSEAFRVLPPSTSLKKDTTWLHTHSPG